MSFKSMSRSLSATRSPLSPRRAHGLLGLGLLSALGAPLVGCGSEAADGERSIPVEKISNASQALAPTCMTIVRGGAGAVSDTRLRQDTPTTAYGSVATLVTGNVSTNRVTLLGFDVSAIPAGSVITSASVTLDEVLNLGASTVSVYPVTAAWNEATVTWAGFNNAYGAAAATSFSNGGSGHTGPISFSISSLVQGWVSGTANHGIALLATTNSTWSSSEATTAALRPSLSVCYLPLAVAAPSMAGHIDAGFGHSLALKSDGTMWGVGQNDGGVLGDGTNISPRRTPVQALGLSGVTAVAAGGLLSIALKSDGTVWATGANETGFFGDLSDQLVPVRIEGLSGVTAVSMGGGHLLALKATGEVWAVGDNYYGELGDGTNTTSSTPVQMSGLSGITAVSGGGGQSLVLKSDGTVWATGDNSSGQLGDGTTTDRNAPVQVLGLSGVTAVSMGGAHSLALKSDGTVWAAGNNTFGQLGDGTTTSRSTPAQVPGLSGIVAISGGDYHSLALKSDGTVWGMGWNLHGELGDGTTISRTTPVQVLGLSGVVAISGGGHHSLALKSDGTIWAAGENGWGQLGDGTTAYQQTPAVLSLLP